MTKEKKAAIARYQAALEAIRTYTAHQREQQPRVFEAGYDTAEYERLDREVVAAEQHAKAVGASLVWHEG